MVKWIFSNNIKKLFYKVFYIKIKWVYHQIIGIHKELNVQYLIYQFLEGSVVIITGASSGLGK